MHSLVKLKHYVCCVIYAFGVSRIINRIIKLWYGSRAPLIVLCYHSVKEEESFLFERQLDYAIKKEFKFINGSKLIELMENHDSFDKQTKYICLTFDDCHLDNYSVVSWILRRRSIPAIFFAPTRKLGDVTNWDPNIQDNPIMSATQLQEMSRNFDIGSHTQNHIRLAEVVSTVAEKEILGSQKDLLELIGKNIDFLAYPNGSYNDNLLRIVSAINFKAGFTIDQHTNYCFDEKYRLGRYIVKPSDNFEFKLKINGGYDWFFFLKEIGRKYIWGRKQCAVIFKHMVGILKS